MKIGIIYSNYRPISAICKTQILKAFTGFAESALQDFLKQNTQHHSADCPH